MRRASKRLVVVLVTFALSLLLFTSDHAVAGSHPDADLPDDISLSATAPALASGPATQSGAQLRALVESGSAETSGAVPFDFYRLPLKIRILAQEQLPFNGPTVMVSDPSWVFDQYGVRMKVIDGVLYNHVSQQAVYALDNLNSYRLTGRSVYLSRAKTQARRVIERAVDVDGAWFHPYDFPWGGTKPPWYSALGQGRALMLFCRLYEATGDEIYRDAADKTFASFLVKGPREKPWVVDVDESNRLWLQEYPGEPSDYTYNGHMVGVYGLYDYYRVTRDARALALVRGSLTTQLVAAGDFRQPAWRSLYCLKHGLTATAAYHQIHIKFFLYSHRITGDYRFARFADTYEADYPRDRMHGWIRISKGRHEAITPSGRSTWISLSRPSAMSASFRRRLKGRPGYWFWISSGPYGGYWIREKAGSVFYPGQLVRMDYLPRRTLLVPKTGTYVLRKYSSTGAIASTKYLRFPTTSSPGSLQLPIRARAVIRGRSHVLVSSGTYSSYWIELRGVTLK